MIAPVYIIRNRQTQWQGGVSRAIFLDVVLRQPDTYEIVYAEDEQGIRGTRVDFASTPTDDPPPPPSPKPAPTPTPEPEPTTAPEPDDEADYTYHPNGRWVIRENGEVVARGTGKKALRQALAKYA